MLKAVIAGDTLDLMGGLREMCAGLDTVVVKTFSLTESSESISRMVSSAGPDVVFVELSPAHLPAALDLARQLQFSPSGAIVIGFAYEPPEQRSTLESGILRTLVAPFDEQEFFQTIRLAIRKQKTASSVHGFMPAKGGAGATVTALNTASCLGQFLKRKVLLIEADFYSGILPLLLKFAPQASVMDALEMSHRLDERSWESMVTKRHGIDILAAWGARTAGQDSPINFDRLLTFVRQRYDFVIVDLPVIVDRVAEVVSYHAKSMYVVSTPEPICMDVARRRLRQLESKGARPSSLGVILNRANGHPTAEELQEHARTIGGNICGVLPNDYLRVQLAIAEEKPIPPNSPLGKAYLALASSIAGVEVRGPAQEKTSGLRNLFARLKGAETPVSK